MGDTQGGSQADGDALPGVMLHGSPYSGINEFDPYGRSGYGLFGMGTYLTDNPRIAAQYSAKGLSRAQRSGDGKRTVYAVEQSVQNPTYLPIMLFEGRKPRDYNRYSAPKPDPKRPANCVLTLTAGQERWTNDAGGTLETKIAAISAGLIVEDERIFRNLMREAAKVQAAAHGGREATRAREGRSREPATCCNREGRRGAIGGLARKRAAGGG